MMYYDIDYLCMCTCVVAEENAFFMYGCSQHSAESGYKLTI
jgi:hypothetical protein